jgi:hypothetical protein
MHGHAQSVEVRVEEAFYPPVRGVACLYAAAENQSRT